jgi:hypothetical protein
MKHDGIARDPKTDPSAVAGPGRCSSRSSTGLRCWNRAGHVGLHQAPGVEWLDRPLRTSHPGGKPASTGLCAVPWSFKDQGKPCPMPAKVVVRDEKGVEAPFCAEHWIEALKRSEGRIKAVALVESKLASLAYGEMIVPWYGCAACGWSGIDPECETHLGARTCPARHEGKLTNIGYRCRGCNGCWTTLTDAVDHTCRMGGFAQLPGDQKDSEEGVER